MANEDWLTRLERDSRAIELQNAIQHIERANIPRYNTLLAYYRQVVQQIEDTLDGRRDDLVLGTLFKQRRGLDRRIRYVGIELSVAEKYRRIQNGS